VSKYEREFKSMYEAVFVEFGIREWEFLRRKKHPCVSFKLPAGQQATFVYSGSASDKRSVLNHRSDARKFLIARGLVAHAPA